MIYDTIKMQLDEKGKVSFRPLSFAEIDAVEMHAWKTHGNKKTFYAGAPTKGYKKMRDYNWTNSSEGLGF